MVQFLKNKGSIDVSHKTSTVCTSCQLSKSCRLPFVEDHVRESVHLVDDLCGKALVTSNQGFLYYALFVDDHTRFSWFYPLKNKSDFYKCFVEIHKMV